MNIKCCAVYNCLYPWDMKRKHGCPHFLDGCTSVLREWVTSSRSQNPLQPRLIQMICTASPGDVWLFWDQEPVASFKEDPSSSGLCESSSLEWDPSSRMKKLSEESSLPGLKPGGHTRFDCRPRQTQVQRCSVSVMNFVQRIGKGMLPHWGRGTQNPEGMSWTVSTFSPREFPLPICLTRAEESRELLHSPTIKG